MPTPFTKMAQAPLGGINVGANAAVAAILPLLAQIQVMLTGAFGLGPLKADIVAQFQASVAIGVAVGDPLAMLKAAIAASAQLIASLQAAIAIGIPPISIQLSAQISIAAALEAKIGGINLLIDASLGIRLAGINFVAQLQAALSAGPATLYAWTNTPMAAIQGQIAGYPFLSDGYAPGDSVSGVMILAKDPSFYAGASFLFLMPAPLRRHPMDLFVDSKLTFEKTAGAEVTLPEDPGQWDMEILQELYKQAPYVADFDPTVAMDRLDAERKAAFGHIDIHNKTEIQPGNPAGEQAGGVRHVRIPIIVRDGKLQPFDVIVTEDSRMVPLTERRLRSALFRPQTFDVTSRTPGDQSLASTLYPPYRQNYGFGGGGGAVVSGGMGKEGSAKTAFLLEALLPTIRESDYQELASTLKDPMMKAAAMQNAESLLPLMVFLDGYKMREPCTTEKVASTVKPTVVDVTKVASGYRVKTANPAAWQPSERTIDRGQLVGLFGAQGALAIDKLGGATMAEDAPVDGDEPEAAQPELVKEFGLYKVRTMDGNDLVGFVFPNVLGMDGTLMPMALFTNGSQTAFQGEIFGVRVGSGAAMISGRPKGYGCFVRTLPNGMMEATVPLEVHAGLGGEMRGNSGPGLLAETFDGTQLHLSVQPGVQKPCMADPQSAVIPDTMTWMPLDKSQSVALASNLDEYGPAVVKEASAYVTVRADSTGVVSIDGQPVEKVASSERHFVSVPDAVFLLAGLGVTPRYAGEKIGQAAAFGRPVQVKVARAIETFENLKKEAMEKAASANIPLRRYALVKEALVTPDQDAVDAILSLGFINPENMLTFITYLPTLNKAQEHLCEMLVASRMGVRELPEYAIERAIRSLEEAIEGLSLIAFHKN